MGREAIIVSPYFPPSSVAGVHRARHLAKHLPATGWRPIVVCVHEACHEQRPDPDLAALVPNTAETVKVPALPARLTRAFGVGEISLRAWRPMKRALFDLLATRPISVVLITGSPFYPMLLASEIRSRFNLPVVLDFQDPWVSNWGANQSSASKAGIAHRLATWLEPRALRGADFVTSVSEVQNNQMRARYAWLGGERMAAIPIGGDPDDFAALRTGHKMAGSDAPAGEIRFSYVGTLLPHAGPLVRTLFRAFRKLRAGAPRLAERIRLHFVGTSNQQNDFTTFRARTIAEEEGVADAVHETPNRLPYLDALRELSQAQGILLIGSDEPHYTASKIYPALMAGRPFLSLFHRASSAHKILSAAGGGRALAFDGPEELARLEDALAEGMCVLAASPETFGHADPHAYWPYEARNIAGRFAHIFDQVAEQRTP
jgi:Glycosyl transferase 4-like domain